MSTASTITIKTNSTVSIPSWALAGPIVNPQSDGLNGWLQVFSRSDYTCVYCGKKLLVHLDHIIGSTTDHIVPQCVFTGGASFSPNHRDNLAASCAVCNNLKGDFIPVAGDPAWIDRASYLEAMRERIRARRGAKQTFYAALISQIDIHCPFLHDAEKIAPKTLVSCSPSSLATINPNPQEKCLSQPQ